MARTRSGFDTGAAKAALMVFIAALLSPFGGVQFEPPSAEPPRRSPPRRARKAPRRGVASGSPGDGQGPSQQWW